MGELKFWAGVEAGMDLDGIILQNVSVLLGVGALMVLLLYAGDRYEETGSRSLTIADLKRFRSLTLVEKTFTVLVVILVMGITVGVGLTLAVFLHPLMGVAAPCELPRSARTTRASAKERTRPRLSGRRRCS